MILLLRIHMLNFFIFFGWGGGGLDLVITCSKNPNPTTEKKCFFFFCLFLFLGGSTGSDFFYKESKSIFFWGWGGLGVRGWG